MYDRTRVEPSYRIPVDDRPSFVPMAQEAGMWPYFRRIDSNGGAVAVIEGKERLMFGSRDYLGLMTHPLVKEAAHSAIDEYGTGVMGANVNGTTALQQELEAEIADWFGTEGTLIFNSGYQANIGALTGMVGKGDQVICDSAEHASIIDGATLSGAELRTYRHGSLKRLAALLAQGSQRTGAALVAVDGVFSSDGSVCDLRTIVDLCREHGAELIVDEAHSLGVIGGRGAGACDLLGVEDQVTVRTGTFSKALASSGGFVTGPVAVLDRMRLKARPLMFSAAAVPAALGAALAAVRICRSTEGLELAERVRSHARHLRAGLDSLGLDVVGDGAGDTTIVAVNVGGEVQAMSLWKELFDAGVFVNAVMYPATRPGRGLVRLNVMAAHEVSDLDAALGTFERILNEADPGFFTPGDQG